MRLTGLTQVRHPQNAQCTENRRRANEVDRISIDKPDSMLKFGVILKQRLCMIQSGGTNGR